MRASLNRRFVLRLLAGAATLLPGTIRSQESPRDQGIGGTGMMRTDEPRNGSLGEGDRGIGGTGVIGTIRRFGSIVVNDLRIAYPPEVEVRIDGTAARAADLKIGQVVHVVARPEGGGLATRRIDVTSEVVGPVESVAPGLPWCGLPVRRNLHLPVSIRPRGPQQRRHGPHGGPHQSPA
ncbi:hypothetical protein OMR07_17215, partial [Methylobacterium organophilum]|nr:hypothetical protein [Methylobacterium organophilum]